MPEYVDTLIEPRWIVPVEPTGVVLENHVVVIDKGTIVAIEDAALARQRYAAEEHVKLDTHIVVPGLINSHTHAAMTLFRGLADDLPLMEWLNQHIWPSEAHWANESFVQTGAQLAIAEMLSGGTTCFNDMYFFPDRVARTAQDCGIRAVVGLIMIDLPTAWAQNSEEYIRKGIAVHDEARNLELVSTSFAPHAPYTVSDQSLRKIQTLADELGIPIHMHVHETEHEIEESIRLHKMRPIERLSQLGLLTPRLIGVHMTQLLDSEIEALAEAGVSVVHCPESNLKLASGLCPLKSLVDAGVNLALGTDGAASNNDLDMISEMRTAALLAKGTASDPTAVPANQALAMATIDGARALGLDHIIGSLVPGKAADLIAVDFAHPATQPVHDPVVQLVYSSGRDQVSDVWVNGKRLLKNKSHTELDLTALFDEVASLGARIYRYDHQRAAKRT